MFGLILSCVAVFGTVTAGIVMRGTGFRGSKRMLACIAAFSFGVLLLGAAVNLTAAVPAASAAESAGEAAARVAPAEAGYGMGFISMALATGLACIGAGVAVGSVGSAAIGLVGEQPGAIGTTLIYVGLAEGVAIYGIVISMLIFSKLA
ncbi:MAG: ATP synthase subunit C [Synergistaceae bacterium]|jgi:V/A-type H+-transporting ATPase subunit K|nr:ATP synthase subunit C [Synergistaceae bacterium]